VLYEVFPQSYLSIRLFFTTKTIYPGALFWFTFAVERFSNIKVQCFAQTCCLSQLDVSTRTKDWEKTNCFRSRKLRIR